MPHNIIKPRVTSSCCFFFLSDQESSVDAILDVIYVTYFEKGAEIIIFFFSLFLFDHVLEVEIKVIENTNHAIKSFLYN